LDKTQAIGSGRQHTVQEAALNDAVADTSSPGDCFRVDATVFVIGQTIHRDTLLTGCLLDYFTATAQWDFQVPLESLRERSLARLGSAKDRNDHGF
jgi:hypothetical protein